MKSKVNRNTNNNKNKDERRLFLERVESTLRFSLSTASIQQVLDDFYWLKKQFSQLEDEKYKHVNQASTSNIKYNVKIPNKKEHSILDPKIIMKNAKQNVTKDNYITYPKK